MQVKAVQKVLDLKDYSVSGESFELFLDVELDLLKTVPQPMGEALNTYYESDDYISHTDSKRNAFEKLYQFVKEITLKNKVALLDGFGMQSKIVLDIGCGTGDFLTVAQTKGWKGLGIEPSLKAQTISKSKGVTILENIESLADESVDVVTMWHVLEHVPDLNQQIIAIKRVLKKGGILIVAVPNFKSYDANHYGKYWAAYDTPRHLWHFSQNAIKRIFDNYDMKLEHTKPMWFDSFYVSMLSEKYKRGKINMLKAFWIGLLSNLKALRTSEFSSIIYQIRK